MKLKHFAATQVHGYMDFDIEFDPELTYLTGINGSGKTTVLRCVSALVSCSLLTLARTRFGRMDLALEHEGKDLAISAERQGRRLILRTDPGGECEAPTLDEGDKYGLGYGRDRAEGEERYYDELLMRLQQEENAALRQLGSLPPPIVLGLDRTSGVPGSPLSSGIARRPLLAFRSPRPRYTDASLRQASDLAGQSWRAWQAQRTDLTDQLRLDILASLMRCRLDEDRDGMRVPAIMASAIEANRKTVCDALLALGMKQQNVDELLTFYDDLAEVARAFPNGADLGDIFRAEGDKQKAAVLWLIRADQYERIQRVFEIVEAYNKRIGDVGRPIETYLSLVNRFLRDSGKTLGYSDLGELEVSTGRGSPFPISCLSSGERQIVVMITHLSFNTEARRAGVFIVDEPELSLHLRWQEQFVAAIREASPSMQLVLATHSPSIILGDTDHCVDLSGEAI